MEINVVILESLIIISTPVFSQFNNEIKPDVTFGDHNDRFDVSDLISYQNKYFRADGSIDYRRSHGFKRKHNFLRSGWNPDDKNWAFGSERRKKKFAQRLHKETEEQLNRLANIILLRINSRRHTDKNNLDFNDNIYNADGDTYIFNENLEKFDKLSRKSRGGHAPNYRRIGGAPDTFNYAFPIEMQVNGYLIPPENL